MLAYAATQSTLARAQSTAAGNAVIVTEWAIKFDGWGTAMRAVDCATQKPFEPLDEELHKHFETMLFWDRELSGGPVRGRDRDRVQRPIAELISAGLNEDFVATYAIAHGAHDHLARDIRAHYRHVASNRVPRSYR